MHVHHPGWTINVVSEESLPRYVQRKAPSGLESLGIQQRSDWYRLALLAEYGGVWLDATVYMLRPISRCFDLVTTADIQGFLWPGVDPTDPRHPPVLEVWALACPRGNWAVYAWLHEWEWAIRIGLDLYFKMQPRLPVMLRHPYFSVTIACPGRHSMSTGPRLAVHRRHSRRMQLRLQNSDAEGGPYHLHQLCGWEPSRIARALVTHDLRLTSCCFVKIRSADRAALDDQEAKGTTT